MKTIPLLVLFGPTASGKSALAVELCRHIGGEVVTADSMQVYKEMNIGTAKPTWEEQKGVPHHMIDVVGPEVNYTLADYVKQAKEVIGKIVQRGNIPVLAGGTGLYIDTVCDNIRLSESQEDPAYRRELEMLAKAEGVEAVHQLLRQADPEAAQTIHPNNIKRVIRTLERQKQTGMTLKEQQAASRMEPSPYRTLKFGIQMERQALCARIHSRVDQMLNQGLVEEVRALKNKGLDESYHSMQGLGYKEILWYLDGKMSLQEAVALLKQGTCQYAKRQMTWFKREKDAHWVEFTEKKIQEIFQKSLEFCSNV